MFFGSIPALITPFDNSSIDFPSFQKIIEWSISHGSHGFVPCGTTGESPTLSHEEHKNVVEECIRIVDKRVPVIAGTGSNNTKEAIEFTEPGDIAFAKIAQKSLVNGTTMPSGLKIPTRGNLWRIVNNYAIMNYGY